MRDACNIPSNYKEWDENPSIQIHGVKMPMDEFGALWALLSSIERFLIK